MRQYLIDAFASRPFRGNPACVVEPFDAWPDDAFMQALAMENNQAETAFLLKTKDPARFGLRWFTPAMEAPLCGHATLATAQALFSELGHTADLLRFDSQAGELTARRCADGRLELDFPAYVPQEIAPMPELEAILGVKPVALYGGPVLIARLGSEAEVRALKPEIQRLPHYPGTVFNERHVAVTAFADAGQPFDAVSRLFAPDMGIDEDPATGSLHCVLTPLYHRLTGKTQFEFFQAFPRRGAELQCELVSDRVKLRGHAVTVARCELLVEPTC